MCSIIGFTSRDVPEELFLKCFNRTLSRGPDTTRIINTGAGIMGFHRLAIMGLSEEAMQPFVRDGNALVCNGEIYGFRAVRQKLSAKYDFASDSDCEVLLPLYEEYGLDMFAMLDAEFALILYDAKKDVFIAARDPIGIRPLYYARGADGAMLFASEAKNLVGLSDEIRPFPPGHYYDGKRFVCYRDMSKVEKVCHDDLDTACRNIREKLIAGIEKRLDADVPVGFLLSGGLDSSLVCSVSWAATPST